MFTGLVQSLGVIRHWHEGHLHVAYPDMDLSQWQLGDSLAVDGVCLTVTELTDEGVCAYIAPETARLTTFVYEHDLVGKQVNLEPCLRLSDPLGGHLVTGHIDGTVTCLRQKQEAESRKLDFSVAANLAPFIAKKGSVALNGVSLTVTDVTDSQFSVMLIPHTMSHTNLGQVTVGRVVNIEVDMMARYLQRYQEAKVHG